ncbi:MAG: phage portal protein [Phycisphaerae bacterium]|nr:phage portal protein [Phycisphaerae bacterium]MCZ2399291.1 phage portal protein [Phycisphaerae bacterium]NUQ48554.1 phage portal protein [Phycisphaerae bacterium]
MLTWLRQLVLPGATPRRIARVRAKYDAAQTTHENRRHWANADLLSANAANSAEVRRVLRSRARYEVANNSYAKGIVQTLAHYVVGTGPRLQMLTEDAEANRLIEREFLRWARAIGLAHKLRTMRIAQAESGEVFGVLATNQRVAAPVQLDLKLVEADQVATPITLRASCGQDNVIDGVMLDEFRNPVAYFVMRRHPGDAGPFTLEGSDFELLPAETVIHLHRTERPGQNRGVPEITPALPLFAMLRRYTLAVLGSAEQAALPSGVIYTDAPADAEAAGVEPMDSVEMERGTWLTMPFGWKIGQVKAEQPTTVYRDFKHEIINEIARCLNMPFNIAAGNSSGYNYASGRLDHQAFFKSVRIDQAFLADVVLDRVFAAWLSEAVLIENYLPQAARSVDVDLPHQWFWDGFEHVDPAKEASAQDVRLRSGLTSFPREYAILGLDYEEEQRKQAEALGVSLDEYRRMLRESLFGGAKSAAQPQDRPDDPASEEELANARAAA